MSKSHDKRRRTDLDLFVLALIDGGVTTPYDLQKSAGLSQGATTPALQRLLEARAVRQGKPGVRGRTDYRITAAGRKVLKAGWLPLLQAGPTGDLDADLRVALLAMWGSGDRRLAADFLLGSAHKKTEAVPVVAVADHPDAVAPLARWYTELRSGTTKALLEAESDAIRAMANALPRNLTGKPRRSNLTPKAQSGP